MSQLIPVGYSRDCSWFERLMERERDADIHFIPLPHNLPSTATHTLTYARTMVNKKLYGKTDQSGRKHMRGYIWFVRQMGGKVRTNDHSIWAQLMTRCKTSRATLPAHRQINLMAVEQTPSGYDRFDKKTDKMLT